MCEDLSCTCTLSVEATFYFASQVVGKFFSPHVGWQKRCALINMNEYVMKGEGNKQKQDTKREERTEKISEKN